MNITHQVQPNICCYDLVLLVLDKEKLVETCKNVEIRLTNFKEVHQFHTCIDRPQSFFDTSLKILTLALPVVPVTNIR